LRIAHGATLSLKPRRVRADLTPVRPVAGYDSRVIERFAEQLLAKADSVRVGAAVTGGILGVLFGSVPLTPLETVWPIPARFGVATIMVGALIGVLIGWIVGEGRAFRYRAQAQMALFQLEIERKVEAAVMAASKASARAPGAAEAAPAAVAPPVEPAPELPPVQLPPPLSPLLRQPDAEPELPPLSPPIAL
jgi:hypothetical protein